MDELVGILKNTALFARLSESELTRIASLTVSRSCRKGEVLFFKGDKATGFYILRQGRIKVFRITPAGRESIHYIVGRGESFAEAASFIDMDYPANAEALEDSRLVYFPKDRFLKHLNGKPELAIKMLASMAMRLKKLTDQIHSLTGRNVEERVADYIIKHLGEKTDSGSFDIGFDIETDKNILASRLGTTPETLSRTFRRLKENGIISLNKKRITILDTKALYQISGSDF